MYSPGFVFVWLQIGCGCVLNTRPSSWLVDLLVCNALLQVLVTSPSPQAPRSRAEDTPFLVGSSLKPSPFFVFLHHDHIFVNSHFIQSPFIVSCQYTIWFMVEFELLHFYQIVPQYFCVGQYYDSNIQHHQKGNYVAFLMYRYIKHIKVLTYLQ